MTAVQQHYVVFYSPGTFVAEQTSKPVAGWNVETAVEIARGIQERHGSVPYGFCFVTRGRQADDLDSKEIARSCFYWLGGVIETLAEVKARNDPKDKILISNMEVNDYARIITNTNSWKWTQPLNDGDIVLEWKK